MHRAFLLGNLLLLVVAVSVGCGTGSPNQGGLKISSSASPSISALQPNATPVNSVPFTLTVNGANFDSGAVVVWNGNPLLTRFVGPGQLLATLTNADLMFAGAIPVYVRMGSINSNTVTFELH